MTHYETLYHEERDRAVMLLQDVADLKDEISKLEDSVSNLDEDKDTLERDLAEASGRLEALEALLFEIVNWIESYESDCHTAEDVIGYIQNEIQEYEESKE